MRHSIKWLAAAIFSSSVLSGCLLVPEPVEAPVILEPVVVNVPPPPTCFDVSAVQRVEIPAETRTVVGISLIENPPYEPIQQRVEQDIITKQAEVFYVLVDPETGNQTEVTNFCDAGVVIGPVGPREGEAVGGPRGG